MLHRSQRLSQNTLAIKAPNRPWVNFVIYQSHRFYLDSSAIVKTIDQVLRDHKHTSRAKKCKLYCTKTM